MDDNILIIILCIIASIIVSICCNYERIKDKINCNCLKKKYNTGLSISEMKIVIDNLDKKEDKKEDEIELL